MSSAYFFAAIVILVHGIYSTRDASQEWLATALASCMIPGVFLALTIPLWLHKARPIDEPTKPQ